MRWSLGWDIMERKALEEEQTGEKQFTSEKGKSLGKSAFPTEHTLMQIIRYPKHK